MNATDIDLDSLLKRLHLANTRRIWRDLIVRAETEQWPFHHFLAVLVSEEVAHRQQTRLGRLSRRAEFPFLKTIDDFDFTFQSTLRLALLGSALAPDFVTEGRCLILHGKPGRGKTHLAVAIAYRAIQNGFDALFVTAAELIDELSAAFRKGQLGQALTRYTHPHILVVDEVGYLTYGTDAANMLFHVVNDRHKRRRAMIFTTNKPLRAWGAVLHDEDLAHAIVDRILERGRVLHLDGPSMRTRHLGLDDLSTVGVSPQVGGISGIGRAEFPEPSCVTPTGDCAFIAIEMKYSETMSETPAALRPRYDELSASLPVFRDPAAQELRQAPLQQLWREHMLSRAMVKSGTYSQGLFVVIHPEQNTNCGAATRAYKRQLASADPAETGFQSVTLEDCLSALAAIGADETASALRHRYLDFGQLEAAIFGS